MKYRKTFRFRNGDDYVDSRTVFYRGSYLTIKGRAFDVKIAVADYANVPVGLTIKLRTKKLNAKRLIRTHWKLVYKGNRERWNGGEESV